MRLQMRERLALQGKFTLSPNLQANFVPKSVKTSSMKWNKSRNTQKFLTESHYNENYLNHQRAYSLV